MRKIEDFSFRKFYPSCTSKLTRLPKQHYLLIKVSIDTALSTHSISDALNRDVPSCYCTMYKCAELWKMGLFNGWALFQSRERQSTYIAKYHFDPKIFFVKISFTKSRYDCSWHLVCFSKGSIYDLETMKLKLQEIKGLRRHPPPQFDARNILSVDTLILWVDVQNAGWGEGKSKVERRFYHRHHFPQTSRLVTLTLPQPKQDRMGFPDSETFPW